MIFTVIRLLWDNPLIRPVIWALTGAVMLGVVLMTVIRDDRAKQKQRDKIRDYETADRLRRRGDAARARIVRPADIRYRD